MEQIYLRPLKLDDADISYKWRNDKFVWEQTGNQPDKYITIDTERHWLASVLNRDNEQRYAICLTQNDKYIGNVQLTDITKKSAQFHIFIGDRTHWGKGIGLEASKKMINLSFKQFDFDYIYLKVKKSNLAAFKIYKKIGFYEKNIDGESIIMHIEKRDE